MRDESSKSIGQTFPDGMTCEHSRQMTETGQSMSSAEDSPVRTSQLQERGRGLLEHAAGCGQSLTGSFAFYDRSTSSWRTYQHSLFGGLVEFSETWPKAGTMRNGNVFQCAILAFPTSGREFGLLPTVTAKGNYNRAGVSSTSGDGLATVVKRLTGFFPGVEFYEVLMGFPPGWTELNA